MNYSKTTSSGRILNELDSLKSNWMHKTECEKINSIRKAIVDLSNANFNHDISPEGNIVVLDELNGLLKKFMGWQED